MNSSLPPFRDEAGERPLETGKKVVKVVAKGAAQSVIDPVTGKPIPSKKVLTQLNQQVAQLAQLRMKKVREELEKQRLKVKQEERVKQVEQAKEKEDVISKVLKASKSTGEFGKNIGG